MSQGERGSATVFVVVAIAALIAVTALVLHIGSATLARDRAEQAADAAALAGAVAALWGPDTACAAARQIADGNGAAVTSCTLIGADVLVELRVTSAPLGREATARARAGPVAAQVPE